ncbi:MAG: CRISPR-associated endonuclease Cas2 [Actinomycetota bacterium]
MARGRRRYLVAYDIRDDVRLRRVHKVVKGFGWPMQYSVFICDLDGIELLQLRSALGDEIHHGVDSVAFIDLGEPQERGRQCFSFMGSAPTLPTTGPVVI